MNLLKDIHKEKIECKLKNLVIESALCYDASE